MVSDSEKKMTVTLNGDVYAQVQSYCEQMSLNENEFMNEIIHCFLEDSLKMLDTMRQGYADMASINLEICTEFEGCDTEVISLG